MKKDEELKIVKTVLYTPNIYKRIFKYRNRDFSLEIMKEDIQLERAAITQRLRKLANNRTRTAIHREKRLLVKDKL